MKAYMGMLYAEAKTTYRSTKAYDQDRDEMGDFTRNGDGERIARDREGGPSGSELTKAYPESGLSQQELRGCLLIHMHPVRF